MLKRKGKKNSDTDKDDKPKPKIEVNFQDGVTWHDFVGFFKLIGILIWRIIRFILAPIFWVYGENVRMIRFIRARGHERVMTDDERYFVETIPFIYTSTGFIGGIILGLFAIVQFEQIITDFLNSLNLEFFNTIFSVIATILIWIWTAIVWIFEGLFFILSGLYNFLIGAFQINPFLVFGGMVVIGIIVMLLWVGITETGALERVSFFLRKVFIWVVGSPERFRLRINTLYRRMNHRLTAYLVGKQRLHTRTQVFFKKSVFYTIILSFYSFAIGIFIGVNPEQYGGAFTTNFERVLFTSLVLFIAGVISGTLFFAVMTRFLDFLNRRKYIAPEFVRDDGVDDKAMKELVEEDEERFYKEMEDQDTRAREMAEKQVEEMEKEREKKRKEREAEKEEFDSDDEEEEK